MNVIHLTHELNSDCLQLPEVQSLIGKKVEITIREIAPAAAHNGWKELMELAIESQLDLDAIEEYREFDRQNWRVNLL